MMHMRWPWQQPCRAKNASNHAAIRQAESHLVMASHFESFIMQYERIRMTGCDLS